MSEPFLDVGGEPVQAEGLTVPRAHALARLAASGALDHVRLAGYRQRVRASGPAREAVLLDVDVERGQIAAHDIRHTERVAAVFHGDDATAPEVLALRPDFPAVPHVNLRAEELPRSLCLYDQPWSQVSLRWTPAAFVEQIRSWLRLTARGELHQDDQPLEPLLLGGYRLVLPADLFDGSDVADPERLDVRLAHDGDGCRVLLAERPGPRLVPSAGVPFVATSFVATEQAHGQIRRSPGNVKDLHDFVLPAGIDLLAALRQRLRGWPRAAQLQSARLIIVIAFPLSRAGGGQVESVDLWAFLTGASVRDLGVSVGAFGRLPGGDVGLLLEPDTARTGDDVSLDVLRPQFAFSRGVAARASGVSPEPVNAVAIGVGALGSQVVQTLVRSGFGRWALVDDDELLPHNLGRHALVPVFVGHPKARGLARQLDLFYREEGGTQAIAADVLAPGDQRERLGQVMGEARVILDMAASVPVSRHLALDVASDARRLGLFLNPRGTDLVLLAEDAGRASPLDGLEMQYYRAAAEDAGLAGHFTPQPGRVRYARSCRDVSAVLPSHLVSLHASIAAGAVRTALQSPGAAVRIWRADPDTLAVTAHEVRPAGIRRHRVGGWTVVLDDQLLARLGRHRAAKLPRETGGVLLGAYDFVRRIIYVVTTLPSPPDSRECTDLYIRGCEGLSTQVEEVMRRTGNQLEYVGEWHSHPDGCGCTPSAKDVTLFRWLATHLGATGQPALMAIVGQGGLSGWCVGSLEPGDRWEINHESPRG